MDGKLKMVDLQSQYQKIKVEVNEAVQRVIDSSSFINGPAVKEFEQSLSDYQGGCHVIACGNGTDALQIALMALGLKPGDEVIVPSFTYVASAEVIALLGLTPVMVDVDDSTFNLTADNLEKAFSSKTRAIIPVHLFGQCCDMYPILDFAQRHNLYVIEDNAQAIGAEYTFPDGLKAKTGTMGTIGCTSFFPSKNLGCFGDGGALFTNDEILAAKIRAIANHGQRVKYHHSVIGCNSRLDSIQAAILNVKLKHIDSYCEARQMAASYYNAKLSAFDPEEKYLILPKVGHFSTHVYHQYTLRIKNGKRDELRSYLQEQGIPTMVYYPLPLQEQEAFMHVAVTSGSLDNAKDCANTVLSLPMHTELSSQMQDKVIDGIISYFSSK